MYDDQCSTQFVNGVRTFLLAVEANKQADGFMSCPCAGCKNDHNYSNSRTIHWHLFESGLMPHYNVWTKHGERGVAMEDNEEEEDDDSYPGHGFPEYDGTTMGKKMSRQWGKKLSRQCGTKLKKRHQLSPLMI